MSKIKIRKGPTDYFKDFRNWPNDWMIVEADKEIGKGLLEVFEDFINSLIDKELSVKTVKSHMSNLSWLGSTIIERLNDGDEKKRRLPTKKLILEYIDDEGGPLLHFLDINDVTDFRYHVAYDGTCKQLYKFISKPK